MPTLSPIIKCRIQDGFSGEPHLFMTHLFMTINAEIRQTYNPERGIGPFSHSIASTSISVASSCSEVPKTVLVSSERAVKRSLHTALAAFTINSHYNEHKRANKHQHMFLIHSSALCLVQISLVLMHSVQI